MRNWRQEGGIVAAVVAGVLAVWWRLLDPDTTFAGMDFLNLLYPQAALAQSVFRAGEVPLWNWHTWGGSPLLAAMQSAVLYPPMWVALTGPLPYSLQVYVLAHLILAAWGAARLCRVFTGRGVSPAVLAGCGYACGTFFLGHIEQTNSVASAAWTPWLLRFTLDLSMTGRGVPRLALACAMGLLAGHPQYVVLALLAAQLLAVVCLGGRCMRRDKGFSWKHAARVWLALQMALVTAALLAAGQVLPTHELSRLSERVRPYADPYSPALSWHVLPARLWSGYLDSAGLSDAALFPVTELGIYAGMAVVPLFAVGLWHLLRRRRPADLALVCVWTLALLYALGRDGFVAPLVNPLVPFLAHSRGTARALAVETLLYVTLAGAGLSALTAAMTRRLGSGRPVVRGLCAVVVLATVGDLVLTAHRGLKHKVVPKDYVAEGLRNAAWPVAGHDDDARIHRFMADDSNYYLDNRPPAVARRMVRLQPNANLIATTATSLLDGYEEALLPTRSYANFLRRFNRNLRFETLDAPLLALMRADTVLTEYPVDRMGPQWRRVSSRMDGEKVYYVLRSQYPTPWFVDEQALREGAGAREGLEVLAPAPPETDTQPDPWFEPMSRTWQNHPYSGLRPESLAEAGQAAGVTVTQQRPAGLELLLEARGEPRCLLFLVPWYPGWYLETKLGAAATSREAVKRAGAIAMRVDVPAAGSPVPARLIFRPYSFRVGMFLSLCAVSALSFYGLLRLRLRWLLHLACE